MRYIAGVAVALGFCSMALGADSGMAPSKVFDRDIRIIESELVPLAEAMPAEKYNFAPTHGEFSGVRTFGQEVSHIASVIHMCAASALEEPIPDAGPGENGPASLKTKDDIVKYLKEAFVHAHKAAANLTSANLTDMVAPAFGKNKVPRVSMVTVFGWHSFDHYGQMVVYARMNGIIPPASRK